MSLKDDYNWLCNFSKTFNKHYLISHGIIKRSFLHPERGDIILLKKAYFLSADKFNDLFTSNFCTEQDLLFFQLTFIKEEKA